MKFMLCSLPRSRSTWLTQLLAGRQGRKVGHDVLVFCKDFEHFLEQYARYGLTGTCETAGMLCWRLFRERMPEARLAVVRRKPEEVSESLQKCGWPAAKEEIELRDAMLDVLERQPGVRSWRYEDLREGEACRDLVEFCTAEKWDEEHWLNIRDLNIQINMQERMEYIKEHHRELAEFKAQVAAQTRLLGGQGKGLH